MGNLFSKFTSSSTPKEKLQQVINYCEVEEPALRNLANMAKNITSTDYLPSLQALYDRSKMYINCNNANSQLLKSQIENLYQDLVVEKAVEVLNKLKEWTLTQPVNVKQEERDQLQLNDLQKRMQDLGKSTLELSEISKYYFRKDTQISDINDVIKILRENANEQLKVVSEAVDVYKARYLFGIILCNYTTGSTGASTERIINDIASYLNVNTYKGCLMFSEFIPILWMTESDFWNLDEMKTKNTTSSTITDSDVELYLQQPYLQQYLINLSTYYSTYFWPKYEQATVNTAFKNCEYNPFYLKSDEFNTLYKIVSPFVDNPKIRSWGEFYKNGREILNKIDTHHFKMLPYMAQKNNFTISGEFMKIPETWPKYDHDVELFEAVLSVANICFANCGGDNSKEIDPNTKMYIPKNIGGYTYKDLGLYNQHARYYDQRAFILTPDDEQFDEISKENRTSNFVKAMELKSEDKWKDFVLNVDANLKDAEFGQDKMITISSDSESKSKTKTNRTCIYNNTGYFTDKIYNCIESTLRIKTDQFPIIPGLSAYRRKTNESEKIKTNTSESKIETSKEEIEAEEEVVETYLSMHPNFMSRDEIKYLDNQDIRNIYKSICIESFDVDDISSKIKYGNNVNIEGNVYTVNPIIETFYTSIKTSALLNNLYMSNNTKLYSSVDYMTNDGEEYSKNPSIPYHIYYNLIPKSLDFELVIPFIPKDFKTSMSICGCDLMNGCSENNLIPFVFSYKKNPSTNKFIDPLFEIDDVEAVKNINVELNDDDLDVSEKEEKKEGFFNRLFEGFKIF